MRKPTAKQLDRVRSKPMVQLTPDEIGMLDAQEQRYIISFLAREPAPWPYKD